MGGERDDELRETERERERESERTGSRPPGRPDERPKHDGRRPHQPRPRLGVREQVIPATNGPLKYSAG